MLSILTIWFRITIYRGHGVWLISMHMLDMLIVKFCSNNIHDFHAQLKFNRVQV